jgi:hypothetical protein
VGCETIGSGATDSQGWEYQFVNRSMLFAQPLNTPIFSASGACGKNHRKGGIAKQEAMLRAAEHRFF